VQHIDPVLIQNFVVIQTLSPHHRWLFIGDLPYAPAVKCEGSASSHPMIECGSLGISTTAEANASSLSCGLGGCGQLSVVSTSVKSIPPSPASPSSPMDRFAACNGAIVAGDGSTNGEDGTSLGEVSSASAAVRGEGFVG
jgi:hypothetical protein